jgi:hypothetical protein
MKADVGMAAVAVLFFMAEPTEAAEKAEFCDSDPATQL